MGWQWYHSIGFPSNYSCCDFHTNLRKPHPVRGLKLTSEPCFCHLQSIIVTQDQMKNCWRHLNEFWGIFTIVKPPIGVGKCLLICLADFCNNAKVTTAMLQISVRCLCRNTKCRADFSRYLKRFIMDSRFLPSSQISGKIYNSVVSNKFTMSKVRRSQTQ